MTDVTIQELAQAFAEAVDALQHIEVVSPNNAFDNTVADFFLAQMRLSRWGQVLNLTNVNNTSTLQDLTNMDDRWAKPPASRDPISDYPGSAFATLKDIVSDTANPFYSSKMTPFPKPTTPPTNETAKVGKLIDDLAKARIPNVYFQAGIDKAWIGADHTFFPALVQSLKGAVDSLYHFFPIDYFAWLAACKAEASQLHQDGILEKATLLKLQERAWAYDKPSGDSIRELNDKMG